MDIYPLWPEGGLGLIPALHGLFAKKNTIVNQKPSKKTGLEAVEMCHQQRSGSDTALTESLPTASLSARHCKHDPLHQQPRFKTMLIPLAFDINISHSRELF